MTKSVQNLVQGLLGGLWRRRGVAAALFGNVLEAHVATDVAWLVALVVKGQTVGPVADEETWVECGTGRTVHFVAIVTLVITGLEQRVELGAYSPWSQQKKNDWQSFTFW